MTEAELAKLEAEKLKEGQKIISDLEKQKSEVEEQKKKMLEEASKIVDDQATKTATLTEDQLQALGDSLGGKEVIKKETIEDAEKEINEIKALTEKKVEKAITIDEVKDQFEAAYKKQVEALEAQALERENKYKKELEDLKLAQMTSKEQEEYKKLQAAKGEAEKMSKMASLVEQLKTERVKQEAEIFEMKKKARDIAFIRSELSEKPWMADVVQQLKIETEEDFVKASVLSEKIKKWKDLETQDLKKGSRNVFGDLIGTELSPEAKTKTDTVKKEMSSLLDSIIRR